MALAQDPRVLTEAMYQAGAIATPDAPAIPGIKYEETPMTLEEADAKLKEMFGKPASQLTKQERSVVHIPGMSDVIHLWPASKPSEQECEAHRIMTYKSPPVPTYAENLKYYEQRKAAGTILPSPLAQDQLDYLKEKRAKISRIRESPTPELVKSFGTVMTWFDDFGDMMTTAAWGGKGALWLATKIGIKVASRAVPYLGWILLAKDIADTVNLFRMIKILGRSAKRMKWQSDGINPFGKKAFASRLTKLAKKLPGVPDWIEIAQTTDQLFGVGISFGPIVGLATDAIFGVIKGSEWRPKRTVSRSIDEIQAHGISGGSWVGTFGQDFKAAEHMEANAAVAAGFDLWGFRAARRLEYAMENKLFELAITPPPVLEPSTRVALEEEGIDPDRAEPWPVPGSPERMTPLEIMKHMQKTVPENLSHWLKPLSRDFRSLPAGEVVDSIVMSGLAKIAGEELDWQESQTPEQRVYHRLMEGKCPWPEGLEDWEREKYVEYLIGFETQGMPVFYAIKQALGAIGRMG